MRVSKRAGFTLIEMLVVIAISGVVATVGLYSYQNAREKARNEVRRSDLRTLQLALERYYAVNKKYPSTCPAPCDNTTGTCYRNNPGTRTCVPASIALNRPYTFSSTEGTCTAFNTSGCSNSGDWIPGLVAGGFIPSLPRDPQEGKSVSIVGDSTCPNGSIKKYTYRSTGYQYKLRAFCSYEGGTSVSTDEAYDPRSPYSLMVTSPLASLPATASGWNLTDACASWAGNWTNPNLPPCW